MTASPRDMTLDTNLLSTSRRCRTSCARAERNELRRRTRLARGVTSAVVADAASVLRNHYASASTRIYATDQMLRNCTNLPGHDLAGQGARAVLAVETGSRRQRECVCLFRDDAAAERKDHVLGEPDTCPDDLSHCRFY